VGDKGKKAKKKSGGCFGWKNVWYHFSWTAGVFGGKSSGMMILDAKRITRNLMEAALAHGIPVLVPPPLKDSRLYSRASRHHNFEDQRTAAKCFFRRSRGCGTSLRIKR
jgi:hypothetical protein